MITYNRGREENKLGEKSTGMGITLIMTVLSIILIIFYPTLLTNTTDTLSGVYSGEELSLVGILKDILKWGILVLLFLVVIFVIPFLVRNISSKLENNTHTKIRVNGRLKEMCLKDINDFVIVGEEKEGKEGKVRRIYTLLEVDRENQLSVDCQVRYLSHEEDYKSDVCLDREITKSEWKKVKTTYKKISKDKKLTYDLDKSQKKVIEDRKNLLKEKQKRLNFQNQYYKEHGENPLPLNLDKERVKLDTKITNLGNNLNKLEEELEELKGRN